MSADELPWYEDIGREPWDDERVEEAIAAWQADHTDADPLHARMVTNRMRRLNGSNG